MAPRKKKTDTVTNTAASGPAKTVAKTRARTAKKGETAAEPVRSERAVTPVERLEGDPSTDIKGDLQRLLDEACKNKTAKDLEVDDEIAQGLRKILLSWRDVEPQDKPQKLAYLLETAHDRKKLCLSALNEEDAKRVTLLDVHARKYGFQVGLGEAVFYEQGYGLRMGGGHGRSYGGHYSGYGSDGDWDWDDLCSPAGGDEVVMEEVHETKLTVENLVDLDGTRLVKFVVLNAGTEAMPDDLEKNLKMHGDTTQNYSASRCSTLELWYRGRALLIWPQRHFFDILHGSYTLKHACDVLETSAAAQPTSETRSLVETILSRADVPKSRDAAKSVCLAAILWGDASLWVRAVRACEADRAISELGSENIVAAIDAFGFDVIKECVERALKQDSNNSSILQFLQALEDRAAGEDDRAAFAFVEEWVPVWRLTVVRTLKKPGVGEAEMIVSAVLRAGDAKMLENTIIPALKTTASPVFMLALAEQVHAAADITPGVKKGIVKDVLVHAILHTKLYATDRYGLYDLETVTFAEAAIKTSLQTGNEASATELAKRLVNFSGLDEGAVRLRSRQVLLPLAGAVSQLAGDHPSANAPAAVKMICDTAVGQLLQSLSKPGMLMGPDREHVKALFNAIRISSTSVSDIIEQLLTLKPGPFVLGHFIEELSSRRAAGTVDGIDALLVALVHKYAPVAGIDAGTLSSLHFGYKPRVVKSLACCVGADVPEACLTIIERVLQQPNATDVSTAVLVICTCLPDMLAQHQRAPTDPAYAVLYTRLYTYWVDVKMAPLRTVTYLDVAVDLLAKGISTWETECDCEDCGALRGFVCGPKEEATFVDVGRAACTHMKQQLVKHFKGQAICERVSGTKQGLKATKYAILLAPSQWRTWKEEANTFLSSLTEKTSEEDIKAIFGDDYARIMQTIRGTAVPANALKRPADGAPAPVASGSGLTAPSAAKRRKV